LQPKEFNILLDIKKHNKTDYFEVVQGDLNSNVLNIALVDGLNPYNLTGTNVEIVFSKPDGTTVQQTDIAVLNAIEGKIQCVLKTNTIAAPGKVIAEVRVLEGETLLTSTRFEFYVRKSLITDETIESTNEFPILTQLINTTNDLIDQVEQIEKQVPEQVVTDLNAVSVLANQLQTDLAAHKAESVSQIIGGARDLTLAGVQSINTQKRPKSIKITANVWNTKKMSIGYYSANVQYALGHVANTSTYAWASNSTVYILENTNDITRGIIQNVTDTGFEIKWEKVGAGATGNVQLFIICQYHGE